MEIAGRKIDSTHPTFIIAEGGLNHNGDIKLAKKMIDEAASCGADAIKFQTYKTEEFVTRSNPYFDLFKNVELSYEDFGELKNYSENRKIIFFSTPFDIESADYLKEISVPCFKIASSDLTNMPLIKHIAKMKTPIIISSGLAIMQEIEEAVNWCLFEGNNEIALLHCVSNYPTSPEEVNLSAMNTMRNKFNVPIGYSDNGESALVDLVAVSMGAEIIEKHFTLDKKLSGPDHSFSIDPQGLKNLIFQIRSIEKMRGDGMKIPQSSEVASRQIIRKSITARRDIKKNEILTTDMISIKRPEGGIEPKYLDQIIGTKINTDIKRDSPIHWYEIY